MFLPIRLLVITCITWGTKGDYSGSWKIMQDFVYIYELTNWIIGWKSFILMYEYRMCENLGAEEVKFIQRILDVLLKAPKIFPFVLINIQ